MYNDFVFLDFSIFLRAYDCIDYNQVLFVLRQSKHLTQAEAASLCSVSLSCWQKYEQYQRPLSLDKCLSFFVKLFYI